MAVEIGTIEALYRYPVKSMRGEPLEAAALGFHGVEGDRRVAVRRVDDRSAFPWLSASSLPELLCFAPRRDEGQGAGGLPTHVRTPEGDDLPLLGDALAADIGRRLGSPVHLMAFRNGLFDDGTVSVITSDTIREIGRLAGRDADVRRFRPNILVRSARAVPFEEDQWVGRVLSFGEGDDAPVVTVQLRDLRCSMINLDPDTAKPSPELLKAVARANDAHAGIYGAVTRAGRLAVGQKIVLR